MGKEVTEMHGESLTLLRVLKGVIGWNIAGRTHPPHAAGVEAAFEKRSKRHSHPGLPGSEKSLG